MVQHSLIHCYYSFRVTCTKWQILLWLYSDDLALGSYNSDLTVPLTIVLDF
jgi:hypothetical protein